jgi:hypothetical protein
MPGGGSDIGVGSNNRAWIIGGIPVGNDFGIWFWRESTCSWNPDPARGAAIRIAVSPEGIPWVINSQQRIFEQKITGTWTEPQPTGRASAIGVGPNESAWVIGAVNGGSNGAAYAWNGTTFAFASSTFTMKEISVGSDGTPWALVNGGTLNNQIVHWAGKWTSLGPAGVLDPPADSMKVSTDVEDISTSNFSNHSLLVGTSAAGVWMANTSSSTWTWTPISDTHFGRGPAQSIGSLAQKPGDPTTIVVATGVTAPTGPSTGNGIWTGSRDQSGQWHWTQAACSPAVGNAVSNGCPLHFRKIRYNRANTNVIYAATFDISSGLYVSTNGGPFIQTPVQLGQVYDIDADANTANGTLYIATSDGRVGVSVDNGNHFVITTPPATPPITPGQPQYPTLAVAPSDASTIYVSISGDDGFHGVFKGTNRLNVPRWTRTNLTASNGSLLRTQGGHDGAIAVSPITPNTVIAAGVQPWISFDGGSTWAQPAQQCPGKFQLHADIHAVAFSSDSNNVLLGTDGGISFSPDGGGRSCIGGTCNCAITWSTANNTIPAMQERGVSVSGDNIVAAAWDNGIHWSFDHGSTWQTTATDGLDTDSQSALIVGPRNEWFVEQALPQKLFKGSVSTQTVTWGNAVLSNMPGTVSPDRMDWTLASGLARVFAIGPSNGTVVELDDGSGNQKPYGPSFVGDSPSTIAAFHDAGGNISVIAGGFVGGGTPTQNLQISTNGGPWSELGGTKLPVGGSNRIWSIKKDLDTNGNIYVHNSAGKVFVDSMADILSSAGVGGLANWVDISGNLPPNLNYRDIVADNARGTVFVASESAGIFKTTNSCATTVLANPAIPCWSTVWQLWNDGFPLSPAEVGTTYPPPATSALRGDPGLAVEALVAQTRADTRFYIYAGTWARGVMLRDATANDP